MFLSFFVGAAYQELLPVTCLVTNPQFSGFLTPPHLVPEEMAGLRWLTMDTLL
jgi:hypothetical protein